GIGGEGGGGGSGEQQAGNHGTPHARAQRASVDHHFNDPLGLFHFHHDSRTPDRDSQAVFGNKPCGSSTNLAAVPLSNWAEPFVATAGLSALALTILAIGSRSLSSAAMSWRL